MLAKGFLASILPHADWAAGIANLGYTTGFLIVILGRMQLFTEGTIAPIPAEAGKARKAAMPVARRTSRKITCVFLT